jgi:hypothetical protein
MPVEALEFNEEARIREEAVHLADGIGRIEGGNEIATSVFDGAHVPGRDVTRGPDQSEGFCATAIHTHLGNPIKTIRQS